MILCIMQCVRQVSPKRIIWTKMSIGLKIRKLTKATKEKTDDNFNIFLCLLIPEFRDFFFTGMVV
jgi:hypothetical protein